MTRDPLSTLVASSTREEGSDERALLNILWACLEKGVEESIPLALEAHKKIVATCEHHADKHPAVFAAIHNIPEIIEFLSPWPVEEQSKRFTEEQWSPLHYAIEHEQGEALLALLHAGFESNLRNTAEQRPIDLAYEHDREKKEDIILFITKNLIEACRVNAIEKATNLILLAQGTSILNKEINDKGTPLMIACAQGYEEIFHALLDRGASVDYVSTGGRTALWQAIESQKIEVVNCLLRQKNISTIINKSPIQYTPLMRACSLGNTDIVQALLDENADLKYFNGNGETALSEALFSKKEEVAKILLLHKDISSIIGIKKRNGETPLMMAAEKGFLEIVESLLDMGASLKCHGPLNKTALSAAISSKNKELIMLLLDHKDISSIINSDEGHEVGTPLIKASRNGLVDIIDSLIDKGASLEYRTLHTGKTALSEAISSKNEEVIEKLLNYKKISSIIDMEKYNQTPLMKAIKNRLVKTVELLLDKGASLDFVSADGRTALSEAISIKNEEIIKILLNHKKIAPIINLKWRDKTPLKSICFDLKKIDVAIHVIYVLTRYGIFLPDDFSLADIQKFPILYAVLLAYFKPIFQTGIKEGEHGYTEDQLAKMREDLCETFSLFSPKEKFLTLAHIESEELIAMLARDKEAASFSLGRPEASETLSPQHLSVENLIDYHRKGSINLFELLPIGIITLNNKIIEASLTFLEDVSDAELMAQDFSIVHALALSSYIAQISPVTNNERITRDGPIKKVLDTLTLYKPALIRALVETEEKFSHRKPLDYVPSSKFAMQKSLYQSGANPFHKSRVNPLSFYTKLRDEENVLGLFTLLKFCNHSNASSLSSLSLSSSALIRLLSKITLRKGEREEDSIVYRIIHFFKIPEFVSKEGYVFPVQEYKVDDIIKLHEARKIDLQSLLLVLLKDFDEKLLTACYQLDFIDFFSSSYPNGTLFHEVQDGRYFSLFSDFLREEVNKLYNPDKQDALEEETYQKYEALLHAFLFAKHDDTPNPFEVYEIENKLLYDEIKELYTEDDGSLAAEVSKEELELLADFKKRYTEHHSLKNKALLEAVEDDSAVFAPASYLPSTSVVCASSSARSSEQEPVHHQASEAAEAEPMEMSTYGFG